ncbi:hypothetical protein [Ferrovibrio terrae]|uniref:hypothetical protein n=1 Tax=Ferrovibrio terrae TaxID=2594003 RepID=UPI003137BAC3
MAYVVIAPFVLACLIGFVAGVVTFGSAALVVASRKPDRTPNGFFAWFDPIDGLKLWLAPREMLTETGQRHWHRLWKAGGVFLGSALFAVCYVALLELIPR